MGEREWETRSSMLPQCCARVEPDRLHVLEVSQGLIEFMQKTEEETKAYLSQPFEKLVHPSDLPRLAWTLQQAAANPAWIQHALLRTPIDIHKPEVGYYWVFVTIVSRPDTDGEPLFELGFTDTTAETRRLEASRREVSHMDEQVLNVLNAVRPALFWKDKNQRFLGANRSFLDFYGFADESIVLGHTNEELGWKDNLDQYYADEMHVLRTGGSVHRAVLQTRGDGEKRWIDTFKNPLYDADGNIVGLASAFTDITMEMKTRMEIQELNAKLTKSMEMLKRASEVEKEFFANISHDMRTPMNAIVGFDKLALETKDEEKREAYLLKIQQSSKLLLQLINDTLDISRISSKKAKMEPHVVDTNHFLESITDTIRATAVTKNVIFHTDLDFDGVQSISVDHVRLTKILMNLLSNAVKFTPTGKDVWLLGRCRREKGSKKATLHFEVKDNGIGMSKEFLPMMFKPFQQERVTSNGTGLGLSIVKGLIERLQGTIACESAPGEGSKFTVDLPVEIAEEQKRKKKQQDTPLGILKGAHILLCEDNELNQEIAVTFLQLQGMVVDTAGDGQVGVSTFDNSDPFFYDAVLMDIRMPVLNGYEAAEGIRHLDRPDAPSVPIIALSANAFEEDVKKSHEAGMNAHLTKPMDMKIVCDTLARLIYAYRMKQDALA